MKLYSYVVTHDYGFAPNPFHGTLTLATCKPQIRKAAQLGDLILGSGSAGGIGRRNIIFLAIISRVMTTQEYSVCSEFQVKIPNRDFQDGTKGDNIYFRDQKEWKVRDNPFHDIGDQPHDLSVERVLACERFWYFGSNAPELPDQFLEVIKKGPGHKITSDRELLSRLVTWASSYPQGINGRPSSIKRQRT